MKTIAILAATAVLSSASPALAAPVPLNGVVTHIETTYFPSFIEFTLSGGDATCPPGGALTYQNANIENMKAALAALFSSSLSGHGLYAWYDPTVPSPFGPGTCSVTFIGLN